MGEMGVHELDFGEVGEAEEADIEERLRLPGTALGAEAPCAVLASLPLGFAELVAARGGWEEAGAGSEAE